MEQMRSEELLAIADTIKILNDDDALELFKKALPASMFIQEQVTTEQMRRKALTVLQGARHGSRHSASRVPLELLAMALRGKNVNFDKVLDMISKLTESLHAEQSDDDSKKEYCEAELDKSEDKKKQLENSISDSEAAIADMEGAIATLKDEIAALTAGIAALDKSVAEATDLRKTEHSDYETLMTDDTNAKEVLLWAKNRLNKFYNPKLYKAPPKRELTDEEGVTV